MKVQVLAAFLLLASSYAEDIYRVGCFEDASERLLPHRVYFGDKTSPKFCSKQCSAYPFFGMEVGTECFCGTDIKKYKRMKDSDCSQKCKGDKRYSCGSNWRVEVYTSSSFKRLGCFADKADRALTTVIAAEGKASPFYCSKACKNSKYFGLQGGDKCTCGDKGYDKYGKLDDSECNDRCSGDLAYTCGGSMINEVYINFEFKRLGCFKDDKDRALPILISAKGKASPQYCAKACKNSTYFGLQAGSDCMCGDKDYDKHGKLDDSKCSKKCDGDPNFTCGSDWIQDVYFNLASL